MNDKISPFIQIIKRIPIFSGLNTEQVLLLLKIFDRRALDIREVLCKYGESSNEMYILLSGQLSIRTSEGVQIALIDPISPVGEMGIFTGEPRSATVLASEKSSLIVLSKAKLESLLRRTPPIELTISRNLIATLSQRLRDANKEIAHLQHLIADIGSAPEPSEEEI